VREAEEPEGLWLAQATPIAIPDGEPPELDQPRLLGRQFQAEIREPVAKLIEDRCASSRCSKPTMW
jgi:hypothetical protein